MPYDAEKAVAYAHRWAYLRNPAFADFEHMGGDCTNFISQCLLAGSARMNYTPTFGWYYTSLNSRTAAWSGVEYLYTFLINNSTIGPHAHEIPLNSARKGDVLQLRFTMAHFSHTLLVVETTPPVSSRSILVACHTIDSDYRPLSSYAYTGIRCLRVSARDA